MHVRLRVPTGSATQSRLQVILTAHAATRLTGPLRTVSRCSVRCAGGSHRTAY